MQTDLKGFLKGYNETRPHQGRGMNGRTPYQVFKAGIRKQKTGMKKAAPKAA